MSNWEEPNVTALYSYTFTRRRIADSLPSRCDTAELAYEHVRDLIHEETELLVVVVLNRKQRAIARETVYRGTVAGMSVRIGELFRTAVRLNGCGILIAHNHPSGDPQPSADDIRTTRDAIAAGRLLGINVVDLLIIGDPGWVSMRREGIAF